MEMYDEDLTVNTFFQSLQADNPVLYDIAATRRWLVCIPRQGSLGKCQFNDTDFENHILFRDEEKDESYYYTVNKKELKVKNNIITTGTGFKEEQRVVPILFEETFFNKNDESYQVLCVNQPLEGATVYGPDPGSDTKQITLHHITDCADLLYKKNANVKVEVALNNHMHQFVQGLAAFEHSSLPDVVAASKSFYLKGLQVVMKDNKLKKRCQNEQGLHETVKVALESFLLHNVYKRLFINICTCTALKDSRFNRITRNLRGLQLKDLDVRPEFCQNVPKARKELSNLVRYFTPLGKLICLKRVFRVLMQSSGTSSGSPTTECMPLTTDDLLPMIMFLIVKAEEGHWWATFSYVTMFRFAKSNSDDEYGFFLATMEAALEHISSNQLRKYLQSRRSKEISMSCSPAKQGTLWHNQDQQTSRLNQFFQLIYRNDLEGMQDILQNEHSPLLDTSVLCHPLCDCDKCVQVIKSSQDATEELKVTLDSVDDRGWTALHMAAYCGHIEILDWLLMQKVDVSAKDIQGHTPLHVACMAGRQSATLLLLHHGAKANLQDNENNTPLHLATLHGYEDCVKALVYYDQGNTILDVDIVNDFGNTALHFASKWGYLSICEILIENGANMKIRNRKNETAEDLAHNLRITHLFVSSVPKKLINFTRSVQRKTAIQRRNSTPAGLKPNLSIQRPRLTGKDVAKSPVRFKVKSQHNPKVDKLLKAVLNQDLELAKFHLQWNEGSDSDNEELSQRPFSSDELCHPLCQCPKCAPVQQLRSPAGKDVHINSQNAEGVAPIHVAAQCGYVNMTKLFLQRGALVNLATYAEGYTPLHLAIKYQRSEVVQMLLRNKAEVNMADARGNTAVHHAAICGSDNILTLLLDYGAFKDMQNLKGNTPLHECCQAGHVTCVRLLVEYGAKVNIRNNANKLPIQLAQRDKVQNIIRYASIKADTEIPSSRTDLAEEIKPNGNGKPSKPGHNNTSNVVTSPVSNLRHTTQPSSMIREVTPSGGNHTVIIKKEQLQQQTLHQSIKAGQQQSLVRSNTINGVQQLSSCNNNNERQAGIPQYIKDRAEDLFYTEAEMAGDIYPGLEVGQGNISMLQNSHPVIHHHQRNNNLKQQVQKSSKLASESTVQWAIGSSEFWSAMDISPQASHNDKPLTTTVDGNTYKHSISGISEAQTNTGFTFKDEYFADNDTQSKIGKSHLTDQLVSNDNKLFDEVSSGVLDDVEHDIKTESESFQTTHVASDSFSEDSRTESEKDLPIE